MSEQTLVTSRRSLLKALSSAPLLPLAGTSLGASLLAACGGDGDGVAGYTPVIGKNSQGKFKVGTATFTGTSAPAATSAADMASVYTGNNTLAVTLADGRTATYKLAYKPFFSTGADVPDGKGGTIKAGGYYNIKGQKIMDKTRQFFSDCPDGSSIITLPNPSVSGVKGNTVFAVVQFEYTNRSEDGTDMYGKLPSPIAVLTLDQNPDTGELKLVKYHNVDTSPAYGLWITCGASLSPWNTHLSSEEYEPDAFAARDKNYMKEFSTNLYGNESSAKVYNYGHLPEVTVNPDGTGSIKKHFCMGRISHELVQVLGDNKTVLMGDDATNSGYFVFVADKEKDLSAGTLYVAKIGAGFSIVPGAAAAPLTWINLGHATSQEIEKLANTLQPTDIMSVVSTDPADASYTKIVANGKTEWIKIKPGMEKAAAFLETHRYAAFKGASMGFTKMEGTTVNLKDKVAYSALQNIQTSMVKGDKRNVPGNGISVDQALMAGAVMQLKLGKSGNDTDGKAINSDWMPLNINALIAGKDQAPDTLGNTADVNTIANPDNLKFNERMRTLFIGEDSGQHVNNFMWAYNVDTGKLTRMLSVPAGAESTGLHAVDDVNGWTYIMSNFQHPGDWGSIHNVVKPMTDDLINKKWNNKFSSAVGYLTGELVSVK